MIDIEKSIKNFGLKGLHSFFVSDDGNCHKQIFVNEPLNRLSPVNVKSFYGGHLPIPIHSSYFDEQTVVIKGHLMIFTFEESLKDETELCWHLMNEWDEDNKVIGSSLIKEKTGRLYNKTDVFSLPAQTLRTFYCSPYAWTAWELSGLGNPAAKPRRFSNGPDILSDARCEFFEKGEAEEILEKSGLVKWLVSA